MRLTRIFLAFFLLLFITSFSYNFYRSVHNVFLNDIKNAQFSINEFHSTFSKLLENGIYIDKAVHNRLKGDELTQLSENNMMLYVVAHDSLAFWNNNEPSFNFKQHTLNKDGSIIQLKNGFYYAIQDNYKNYNVIALLWIKKSYPISNKYLADQFVKPFSFDNKVGIFLDIPSDGSPIYNNKKEIIAKFIQQDDGNLTPTKSAITSSYISIFSLLMIILLLTFLIQKNSGWKQAFIFIGVGMILYMLFLKSKAFAFSKTLLFSPQLYASLQFGSSLGELFINTLVCFILCVFWLLYYRKDKITFNKSTLFIYSIFIVFIFIVYSAVVKSLIIDSVISFEISNITLITIYTVLGSIILLLLSFSMLSIVYIWANSLYKLMGEKSIRISVVLFTLISLLMYFLGFEWAAIISPLVVLLNVLLYYFFLSKKEYYNFGYVWFSTLIAYSILLSALLSYYNVQKEDRRKEIAANQIAENRDLVTEIRFDQIKKEIQNDPFVKRLLLSPFNTGRELNQRLTHVYFGGHLSKYNISCTAFNLNGLPINATKKTTLKNYVNLIDSIGEPTTSNFLYLLPKSEGLSQYISILPLEKDNVLIGNLIIELSPKTYHKDNLYPELLIEQKVNPLTQYNKNTNYNYAIYKNNLLRTQSGEYPFPYNITFYNIDELPSIKIRNGYRLNFFEIDKNTKAIITDNAFSIFTPLNNFSYIFTSTALLIFFLYLAMAAYLSYLKRFSFKNMSFQIKVNLAVVGIIVISFIIISATTVGYFSKLFKTNHTEILIKKQQSILSNIEFLIQQQTNRKNNFNFSAVSNEIASLAKLQDIDINIFDLNGILTSSSQQGIFTNGLISKLMNPKAKYSIITQNNERFIQDESIGKLAYQAVYVPIRNTSGNTIAFLNLPYFAQEQLLKSEFSAFVVALVNVYVMMLILSILIAYFISHSLTRPLDRVGKMLSAIKIGKKNEPIIWEANDEIGALVREYNKMIEQIENSTALLAKSERETAWREMARQIAHEIKNPLTPMKLSIQHLQRSINDQPEELPELSKRVSKTLIEQIDNLSEIATAFSSFAKMPQTSQSKIDLKEIIDNVVNLFNELHKSPITFINEKTDKPMYVLADKNQLLSVFNNLIKNAQQASEHKKNPRIEVHIRDVGQSYIVSVKDNGTGISEDMAKKVFVPNFTTKSSGTGLGLAITKKIVETHDGVIWFDTELDVFTTFYVSLPKLESPL